MVEPVVVPSSARWTLPPGSDEPGIRVSVSLPLGRPRPDVPLVVLLDADFMFLSATEYVRTLKLCTMSEFPGVAIVGLMRDESDPMRYASSRFRDFTPNEWVLPDPFSEDNAIAHMGTGGADAFLGAILDVVIPSVTEHLAVHGHGVGEVAIAGWSLTGLFASWAWLQRPDVFSHLIAISPSLWWNDASILRSSPVPRPNGHRAAIYAGEHEEGDVSLVYPQRFANGPQREFAAMVRNAERFAIRLAGAGVPVDHATITGEHHITVQNAALARGLRFLFADRA